MLTITPYEQQYPGTCGPASLKMVLAYFDIQKTEMELMTLSSATPEHGVDATGLIQAAQHYGLNGFYKDNATLDDIRKYVLQEKIPVIIDWFSVTQAGADGHYSVVVDITNTTISFLDPEFGTLRAMDVPTFFRCWFDFPGNYITSKDDLILRRMIIINRQ